MNALVQDILPLLDEIPQPTSDLLRQACDALQQATSEESFATAKQALARVLTFAATTGSMDEDVTAFLLQEHANTTLHDEAVTAPPETTSKPERMPRKRDVHYLIASLRAKEKRDKRRELQRYAQTTR